MQIGLTFFALFIDIINVIVHVYHCSEPFFCQFYVNCPKIGRLINWVKNQYNINAVFVHFCIS